MELSRLIQFAHAYRDLGWAIQEQLDDIANDGDYSDLNPNALTEINQKLRGYSDDLDWAIDRALAAMSETEGVDAA